MCALLRVPSPHFDDFLNTPLGEMLQCNGSNSTKHELKFQVDAKTLY